MTWLERLLRSEAGWTTLAKVGTAAAAAVVTVATSRVLSADDRGELAAAIAAAVLLGSALSLSLWMGTSVELRRQPSIGHATRRFAILYPAALTLLLTPVAVLVFGGFGESIWPWALWAGIMLTSYSLLQGLPVGEGNMRAYAIGELIRGWPGAIACIAVAAATNDPKIAVIAWGGGAALGAAYLVTASDRSRETSDIRAYLRLVGPQSMRAHAGNVLGLLAIRFDLVLLVGLSSAAQVAYYSMAIAFAEIIWIFSSAQGVAHLADLAREGPERAWELTLNALRRVLAIVIPIGLLIALTAAWLVPAVAGETYEAAVSPLRVSLAAALLLALVHVLGPYMAAGLRRPWLITFNGVAMITVNVGLLVWLAPSQGALGASIASLGAYAISAVIYLAYFVRRPEPDQIDDESAVARASVAAPDIPQ